MTARPKKQHWVFHLHVADRAGALTSIASAFSNRGISIETVVGHGASDSPTHDGAVVATVWCTEQEKDEIVRIVKRLSKVVSLEEHAYDSESLRKSALVYVTQRLTPKDVAGRETFLTCELMQERRDCFEYFLAGSPSELDPVLARLRRRGLIKDIVYSVLGL